MTNQNVAETLCKNWNDAQISRRQQRDVNRAATRGGTPLVTGPDYSPPQQQGVLAQPPSPRERAERQGLEAAALHQAHERVHNNLRTRNTGKRSPAAQLAEDWVRKQQSNRVYYDPRRKGPL